MKEYSSKRTGTVQNSAKKSQVVAQAERLPNSMMLRIVNGNAPTNIDVEDHMESLKRSILARKSRIAPRAQQPIPSAENEAERLSNNVYGITPDTVKSAMGNKLQADFSSVSFHTDPGSAAKADAMGARAFTAGSDIYFGSDGFEASAAAHELVHTVQQGAVIGLGVSTSAPLGGIQMLGNPIKAIKRKIKGQTVEEQEAEERMDAEKKQIRKERNKADSTEKDNRGAPHGAEANKRGVLGTIKEGLSWVGNKIASPFRDIAASHNKSLDDLNLHRAEYDQLSRYERFKHTVKNPLAHIRSGGEKTTAASARHHMSNEVLNDIQAYGVQRERGTSAYSGENVVNLKHVDTDAMEEKRRKMMREQYLAEKAAESGEVAPAVEAAPAGRPRSNAISGGRSPLAINHVPRPNMADPGKGLMDNSRAIDTVDMIAGMGSPVGLATGKIGKSWAGDNGKDGIQELAQKHLGWDVSGGKGFMEGQGAATGMLGGVAGLFNQGKAGIESGIKSVKQLSQGDLAGGVGHGFATASHLVQGASKVVGGISSIPGVNIADQVVPGLGIATGALDVGAGLAQGVRGSLTARNMDNMMDDLEYQKRHGQALPESAPLVAKAAHQMRSQSNVDQISGYTKALSGAMRGAGSIATVSGAGAIPGVALNAAGAVTDFVGGKLADRALEDVQHSVGNQEVNLDSDVNERLKGKYSEEKWRGMSGRERDLAREKEQRVMLRFHGQKHGSLEQFTVEESMKRASALAQGANSGDALSKKLVKGTGVSGWGGKFSEAAIGRKLYSRNGEDLADANERLERENGSEIQQKLRKKLAK